MVKPKVIFVFFILISLGEIISILGNISWLHQFCKPSILPALCLYYILSLAREQRSTTVVMALIFSFFGDTFLLFDDRYPIFFMLGLASFLIAHVLYILAYKQHRFEESEDKLHGVHKIRFAFPVVLAGTGLVIILYPVLGTLQVPVVVYAMVITVMVVQAIFRLHRTSDKSFWMVFTGALLFMISDSVLAINKFLGAIDFAAFIIMSTYIVAQFLIVQGLIAHARQQL